MSAEINEQDSDEPMTNFGGGREAAGRVERIEQYIEQSLAKPDPMEATLGVVTGDLMSMAHRIKRHIDELFEGDPEFVPELDLIAPEIDQYLRVSKQIERFALLTEKRYGRSPASSARKVAEQATRELR
jgi:hypothetical protein